MAGEWVPPRRTYHLRIFFICLAIVALCLTGFLFAVRLEAVVPASGVVTAQDIEEVRTLQPGLVELGWFEGSVSRPGAEPLRVRLDAQGEGVSDPDQGPSLPIPRSELSEAGRQGPVQNLRRHRLQPGDELWPGQVLAWIRMEEARARLAALEEQLKEGDQPAARASLLRERDRLRERLAQAVLRVPPSADRWLVLEVHVSPLQAVQAGDRIATIVPVDPRTHQPRNLVALLDVEEKYWGDLKPGQNVRLYSTVFNHRLFGCAEAQLAQLEPWARPNGQDTRVMKARAPIVQAPYDLPLGSTFKAEIVVGPKLVYRIILEH
jgi:hypothetical protein